MCTNAVLPIQTIPPKLVKLRRCQHFLQLRFLIGLRIEKSLENEVAEPQNRPQNVKKCNTACPNHPPKTCETSPLPETISTSSSTSSACLCPDPQCAKWGAGGVPPDGVFNNIRLPPLLAKGSLGVLDQSLDSCLSLTPLKASPVAPRNPLYRPSSAPLRPLFFNPLRSSRI